MSCHNGRPPQGRPFLKKRYRCRREWTLSRATNKTNAFQHQTSAAVPCMSYSASKNMAQRNDANNSKVQPQEAGLQKQNQSPKTKRFTQEATSLATKTRCGS